MEPNAWRFFELGGSGLRRRLTVGTIRVRPSISTERAIRPSASRWPDSPSARQQRGIINQAIPPGAVGRDGQWRLSLIDGTQRHGGVQTFDRRSIGRIELGDELLVPSGKVGIPVYSDPV